MDGNKLYLMGLVGMTEPEGDNSEESLEKTKTTENDKFSDGPLVDPDTEEERSEDTHDTAFRDGAFSDSDTFEEQGGNTDDDMSPDQQPADPDASEKDSRPLLKIFAGMHNGAQLRLFDGTYKIGSSDDCDIIIKDEGIAENHMLLNCASGRFMVTPRQGIVYVDGHPVDDEQTNLYPQTIATIGPVHFGLVTENANWSPEDLPTIRPLPDATQSDFSDRDQSALSSVLNKLTVRHAKFTGTLIFIVSCLFISIYSFSSVREPDTNEHIARVNKIFTEAQLSEPVIAIDKQGLMTITAYVPTRQEQKQLSEKLRSLSIPLQSHLFAEDDLNEACKTYTSEMQLPIDVRYRGKGKVLVSGFVQNQENFDIVISQIRHNMSGVRKIYNNVKLLERVNPELSSVLQDSELSGKIDFKPTSKALIATGVLDMIERSRWQTAKDMIYARLGDNLNITDRITAKEKIEFTPGRIEMPIASVSIGNYPYITLQDGKVYFKGAAMKNGTLIKDIHPDRIVVEISGREYFYRF